MPTRLPRRFTRAHLWAVVVPFALMALLTSGAVASSRAQDGARDAEGALGIVSAIGACLLGPFHGGFARDWQSCCLANSWSLFPSASTALALALAVQLLPLWNSRTWSWARRLCWTAGWLVWFGAGLFSLGHALE